MSQQIPERQPRPRVAVLQQTRSVKPSRRLDRRSLLNLPPPELRLKKCVGLVDVVSRSSREWRVLRDRATWRRPRRCIRARRRGDGQSRCPKRGCWRGACGLARPYRTSRPNVTCVVVRLTSVTREPTAGQACACGRAPALAGPQCSVVPRGGRCGVTLCRDRVPLEDPGVAPGDESGPCLVRRRWPRSERTSVIAPNRPRLGLRPTRRTSVVPDVASDSPVERFNGDVGDAGDAGTSMCGSRPPAGGRAVAGSNPVSPMRRSCKSTCYAVARGGAKRARGAISATHVLAARHRLAAPTARSVHPVDRQALRSRAVLENPAV